MNQLRTKKQVTEELNKAGINICLTRSVGCNSFNLVHECNRFFTVNAIAGTEFETTKKFSQTWSNINILINT